MRCFSKYNFLDVNFLKGNFLRGNFLRETLSIVKQHYADSGDQLI